MPIDLQLPPDLLNRSVDALESEQVGAVLTVPDSSHGCAREAGSASDIAEVFTDLQPSNEIVNVAHAGEYGTFLSTFQVEEASVPSVAVDESETECEAVRIVADLLERELAASGLSKPAWIRKHQFVGANLKRQMAGKIAMNLRSLQYIADQFGIEPWQVLFPGFRREFPPQLPQLSAQAMDLGKLLDKLPTDARDLIYSNVAHQIETTIELLSRMKTAGPKPPSRPPKRGQAKSRKTPSE